MTKLDGVADVIVDNSARAVIRMTDQKAKLSVGKLNKALSELRGMKARKLARRKFPLKRGEFIVKMEGFS